MSDYQSLIERVEGLSGACRGTDADLFIATTPEVQNAGRIDRLDGVVGWWPKNGLYQSAREVPRYTASIDAALSLVERKLPGWSWRIGNRPGGGAWVLLGTSPKDHLGATPALALVLALLRALQSQEPSP